MTGAWSKTGGAGDPQPDNREFKARKCKNSKPIVGVKDFKDYSNLTSRKDPKIVSPHTYSITSGSKPSRSRRLLINFFRASPNIFCNFVDASSNIFSPQVEGKHDEACIAMLNNFYADGAVSCLDITIIIIIIIIIAIVISVVIMYCVKSNMVFLWL